MLESPGTRWSASPSISRVNSDWAGLHALYDIIWPGWDRGLSRRTSTFTSVIRIMYLHEAETVTVMLGSAWDSRSSTNRMSTGEKNSECMLITADDPGAMRMSSLLQIVMREPASSSVAMTDIDRSSTEYGRSDLISYVPSKQTSIPSIEIDAGSRADMATVPFGMSMAIMAMTRTARDITAGTTFRTVLPFPIRSSSTSIT